MAMRMWLSAATALLSICGARAAEPPAAPLSRPVTDPKPAAMDLIEVWVVLSEPALATLPAHATEQRAALQRLIVKQQDEVMAQIAALGGTESGRVQQVSNALAVQLPASALPRVKKIGGVTSVHPVSHRNRIDD
jgi:hypothetical protein